MKRILALTVLLAVALCLPVLAGEEKMMDKADKSMKAKGTITAWNQETKTFKVEDKAGMAWTFKWNDKTMVNGTPKVGEAVKVEFMKDDSGAMWATHVNIMKEEMAKEATQKP